MKDEKFKELYRAAKSGDEKAMQEIIELFKPCITFNSFFNGKLDDDCFQELTIQLMKCIEKFELDNKEDLYTYLGIEKSRE